VKPIYGVNPKSINKKGKKKKKASRMIVIVLLLCFLALLLGVYSRNVVTPVIITASDARVRSVTMTAINNSVYAVLEEMNISYEDTVRITYDNDNAVSMIQAVTPMLNRLAREVINRTQEELRSADKESVPIPLGTFSGITLLSGLGPVLNIGMVPIEEVDCEFRSVFESVGINQTLHKMYITVTATVTLILPMRSIAAVVSGDILIFENIIIGRVPNVYLNNGSIGERLLNLVP
jgi:sporulation protein YunB